LGTGLDTTQINRRGRIGNSKIKKLMYNNVERRHLERYLHASCADSRAYSRLLTCGAIQGMFQSPSETDHARHEMVRPEISATRHKRKIQVSTRAVLYAERGVGDALVLGSHGAVSRDRWPAASGNSFPLRPLISAQFVQHVSSPTPPTTSLIRLHRLETPLYT